MKEYVKPKISFQSLSMATAISTGCAIPTNSAPAQCPVELEGQPGLTVFVETEGCSAYFPGYEDQLCYHVPVADSNVFES